MKPVQRWQDFSFFIIDGCIENSPEIIELMGDIVFKMLFLLPV